MIRDSDNAAAQAIYREMGRTESIEPWPSPTAG
jgi:hypothetical protein